MLLGLQTKGDVSLCDDNFLFILFGGGGGGREQGQWTLQIFARFFLIIPSNTYKTHIEKNYHPWCCGRIFDCPILGLL